MKYDRVYNFSAGPSTLPEPALERAASELLNYKGTGMSVMEMSHRSKVFMELSAETEALLRSVMGVPEGYKVLFLQGGATTQFAMVPMNLMVKNGRADYAVTGNFAKKAWEEAGKYGTANVAASSEDKSFSYIPDQASLKLDPGADYFHICENNTIFGTKWNYTPDTGSVPLVSDMSSCIMSEKVDVSKYGLIYAGAQKNMGPAGVTVVIIREDLIGKPMPFTPSMLNYGIHAKNDSLYNTPATYSLYVCKLVLEWLISIGGITEIEKRNREKAAMLYACLDESDFYKTVSDKSCRSIMNVTFNTGNPETDERFCKEATKAGLSGLKGHRLTGGIRASIYNAMPAEGVAALIDFMRAFELANK